MLKSNIRDALNELKAEKIAIAKEKKTARVNDPIPTHLTPSKLKRWFLARGRVEEAEQIKFTSKNGFTPTKEQIEARKILHVYQTKEEKARKRVLRRLAKKNGMINL